MYITNMIRRKIYETRKERVREGKEERFKRRNSCGGWRGDAFPPPILKITPPSFFRVIC